MTEKVKLPKEVCDALDYLKKHNYDYMTILQKSHRGHWTSTETITLNSVTTENLMQALVLGYEPELSAEEQLKERYENRGDYCTYEHFLGYRDGVKDTLHLHGIKYDWIKGWGEDDAE